MEPPQHTLQARAKPLRLPLPIQLENFEARINFLKSQLTIYTHHLGLLVEHGWAVAPTVEHILALSRDLAENQALASHLRLSMVVSLIHRRSTLAQDPPTGPPAAAPAPPGPAPAAPAPPANCFRPWASKVTGPTWTPPDA